MKKAHSNKKKTGFYNKSASLIHKLQNIFIDKMAFTEIQWPLTAMHI